MKRIRSLGALLLAFVCLLSAVPFAAAEDAGYAMPYDETFEFSYMYYTHPSYTQDNMFDKYLDEYLNMKIDWIQVPYEEYQQKLSVVLASGDLPDVVALEAAQRDSLIAQGAIIQLDELMESTGKNIAAQYDKWNGWKNVRNADDGHIYGVHGVEAIECANCIAIRQDWLDQLNLELPETLDEWLSALYAFKENNLGGEQTYPIGNYVTPFFDAYGIEWTRDYRYVVLEDGSLVNRYEHEHYLEALKLLAKLYQDGIINPYIFTQSSADFDMMVYNNSIGMLMFTGQKIGTEYNVEMEKTIENAWYQPTSPIKGPYGDQTALGRAGVGSDSASITISAKDPEKIMRYLDWQCGEEGLILSNFGIEGVSYDMVDGKPLLRPEWANFTEKLWPNGIGCCYRPMVWTNDQFMQVMFSGKQKDELDKYQLCAYEAYVEVNAGHYHSTYTQFTTPTEAEIGAELWQQLKNAEQQAITGVISIDQFESVLAGVKAAGMDQIMTEAREIWAKLG